LLLSAFLLSASLATAQETPLPPPSHLSTDARSQLAEAAQDSRLEPWQREFMLGVARGNVEGAAAPALSGRSSAPVEIATDDGAWTAFSPPSARAGHTAIYDPVRDRMVVFGGYDANEGNRNDVWALSLSGSLAWSEITPAGSLPSARAYHTAIYDPVRDRMVVFGGLDGGGTRLSDVWALSLSGSPAWSEITPPGSSSSARWGHTAIYDPVRDRMVVFGGNGGGNDVWEFWLAGSPGWGVLAPVGSPPSARQGHTAVYDPVRDRMVVFGGGQCFIQDYVWALSLSESPAWSQLAPGGEVSGHTAIYDPVRDRMVVFGGRGCSLTPGANYSNGVLALSLAGTPAWSSPAPAGSLPFLRGGHTAIYDPLRDRMVVFGGSYNSGGLFPHPSTYYNDVPALSLAGSPAWSELPTPTLLARFDAEVTSAGVRLRWQFGEPERIVSEALERAANPVGPWLSLPLETHRTADATEALDQSVVPGQNYYYRLTANLSDGTRAVFGPISAVAVLAVKVSGLTGIAPNPAAASARIDFALVRGERVRLSVIDIAGREAAILADGPMAPGSYSMMWDGRQGGTRLPAGVYFVRWTSAGKTMNRKLVLVP
jgi:hypothetical protein